MIGGRELLDLNGGDRSAFIAGYALHCMVLQLLLMSKRATGAETRLASLGSTCAGSHRWKIIVTRPSIYQLPRC